MDAELAQGEMEAVQEHLVFCSACRLEHETLVHTKRAVASLANRVSRDEIARLLADAEAEKSTAPPFHWKVAPVAATAFLSLAGLWLATTSLDSPRDWRSMASYEPIPTALTPVSMTPVLAPPTTPVTMATVSNPVTFYSVGPSGEILSRTTVRQVRFYSNMPHPPSLREALNRLFGWHPAHPAPPTGIVMSPGDGVTPLGAPVPLMRALNERDSMPYNESLVPASTFTDRYSAAAMMH
jgi:hypothetical protein